MNEFYLVSHERAAKLGLSWDEPTRLREIELNAIGQVRGLGAAEDWLINYGVGGFVVDCSGRIVLEVDECD